MAAGHNFSLTFRDAKNQTARMSGYVSDAGVTIDEAAAVKAAAAPLTNATVHISTFEVAAAPVAGASADYRDVEDKAVVVMQDAVGGLHRYSIPAPKAGIFLADGETLDFTNADVSGFVAAVIANMVARDGTALTASVGGYRRRSNTQRKFTVRTRNPTLTGQGL